MEDLFASVAANVRRLRAARRLSLAQLTARSGVARSTLTQIEAGAANPTLGTLLALAQALGTSVEELLSPDDAAAQVRIVRAGQGQDISDDAIAGRLVDTTRVAASLVEFHRLEMRGGHAEVSASHGVGAREHVVVIAGRAHIGPSDSPVEVAAGDYVTYAADRPHLWAARGKRPATVWVVATYPTPTT